MHTSPSAAAAAAVTHKLQRSGGHGDGGRRRGGGGGGTRAPLSRRPPLTWLSTSYYVAAAAVTAAVDAVLATARVHLSCGGRSCRKRPHARVPRWPPLPRLRTSCDVAAAAVTAGAGAVVAATRQAGCVLCACVTAAPAADDDARTCGAGVAAAATRGRTGGPRMPFHRCRLPRQAPRDLPLSWPVGTAVVPAAGAAILCVGAAAKLFAASRAEGTALRGAWVRRRWHRAVHGMSAQTSCIGKKNPAQRGKNSMYCYNRPPSSSSRHQSLTATQDTRNNPVQSGSTTRQVRGLGSSK